MNYYASGSHLIIESQSEDQGHNLYTAFGGVEVRHVVVLGHSITTRAGRIGRRSMSSIAAVLGPVKQSDFYLNK